MSVTIEQDLKEILLKIDQRLEKMQGDITDLKIGQTRLEGEIQRVEGEIKRVEGELKGEIKRVEGELKGEIKRVEGELKGEIKRVEEQVEGVSKRIEFQEFINRGVLIGLIVAILGGLAKMFGIIGNS